LPINDRGPSILILMGTRLPTLKEYGNWVTSFIPHRPLSVVPWKTMMISMAMRAIKNSNKPTPGVATIAAPAVRKSPDRQSSMSGATMACSMPLTPAVILWEMMTARMRMNTAVIQMNIPVIFPAHLTVAAAR